ncbi:hypothetical protein CspeluHIS016_0306300 [Cutaneotrichosporon spelunceum]|uniref:Barwin-like endoglucanase n=1 Tax=Cutaneotrichosporon spelunceum TaxID=1672016 RepID=A0AAD3TTU0_9TREE|nr:hypothetical protein CspeluHIS016_0306300 [Cutaneotrichosporon spelunceum]
MLALLSFVSLLLAALALAAPVPHQKRFDGKATYYVAGLGACGGYNTGADMIVALNAAQWDGGAHCGKKIMITEGGKTAQATIVDLCPGCPFGGLDLSENLFSVFHDHGKGVFQLSWNFADGSGGSPKPEPEPTTEDKPAPTPTPAPAPESTPNPAAAPPSEQKPESSSAPAASSSIAPSSISSPDPASVSSSSVLSNSTTVSSTLSNTTLPSSLSSPTANATALLPTASNASSAPAAGDAAIISESPSADGTLADLGEFVASLGKLIVLGAN